jgi:hypothetical protein
MIKTKFQAPTFAEAASHRQAKSQTSTNGRNTNIQKKKKF